MVSISLNESTKSVAKEPSPVSAPPQQATPAAADTGRAAINTAATIAKNTNSVALPVVSAPPQVNRSKKTKKLRTITQNSALTPSTLAAAKIERLRVRAEVLGRLDDQEKARKLTEEMAANSALKQARIAGAVKAQPLVQAVNSAEFRNKRAEFGIKRTIQVYTKGADFANANSINAVLAVGGDTEETPWGHYKEGVQGQQLTGILEANAYELAKKMGYADSFVATELVQAGQRASPLKMKTASDWQPAPTGKGADLPKSPAALEAEQSMKAEVSKGLANRVELPPSGAVSAPRQIPKPPVISPAARVGSFQRNAGITLSAYLDKNKQLPPVPRSELLKLIRMCVVFGMYDAHLKNILVTPDNKLLFFDNGRIFPNSNNVIDMGATIMSPFRSCLLAFPELMDSLTDAERKQLKKELNEDLKRLPALQVSLVAVSNDPRTQGVIDPTKAERATKERIANMLAALDEPDITIQEVIFETFPSYKFFTALVQTCDAIAQNQPPNIQTHSSAVGRESLQTLLNRLKDIGLDPKAILQQCEDPIPIEVILSKIKQEFDAKRAEMFKKLSLIGTKYDIDVAQIQAKFNKLTIYEIFAELKTLLKAKGVEIEVNASLFFPNEVVGQQAAIESVLKHFQRIAALDMRDTGVSALEVINFRFTCDKIKACDLLLLGEDPAPNAVSPRFYLIGLEKSHSLIYCYKNATGQLIKKNLDYTTKPGHIFIDGKEVDMQDLAIGLDTASRFHRKNKTDAMAILNKQTSNPALVLYTTPDPSTKEPRYYCIAKKDNQFSGSVELFFDTKRQAFTIADGSVLDQTMIDQSVVPVL